MQAEEGSVEARAAFHEAALKFESVAKSKTRPGLAWYNAGNAWFEGGELGRSIAAYKQARIYRPFDEKVSRNLDMAQRLTIDRVTMNIYQTWFD